MADTNLLVLAREYKKLREEVKKVLSMPKGDKGDQGEKGEKGDTGDTGPQGFPGRDGKDGINGYDGKDGLNGNDGKDGKDGLDGVGVQNAYIDFDNSLVIVLTDGREVNAGYLSQETKDNVIATFKQGAATINELLPDQAGNTNKVLATDGSNVYWADAGSGGGGGIVSVTATSPVVSSGGSSPNISLASGYGDTQNPFASKTANTFLASPNGSAGAPTFRALVAADVPTLNQNTTGTAANVTGVVAVANGGTGVTNPSLVAGTNITITGTWPNQTIASSGGGGSMVYPGAGIPVSTGTAWDTSKSTPTGGIVGTTDTQTLTNKRITPRSVDITTASTITPTSDTADQYEVTALATSATIAAPSGTPTDGQKLILRFKDNGTARALTWTTTSGAYRAVGVTLPTTTVLSKVLYVGCVWNSQDSFWDVIAVAQQA